MLQSYDHPLSKSLLIALENNTTPSTVRLKGSCTDDFTDEEFIAAMNRNHSVKIIELDRNDKRTIELVCRWLEFKTNRIHGLALHLVPAEAESKLINALLHQNCGVKYLGLCDIGFFIQNQLSDVLATGRICGLTFSLNASLRYLSPLLRQIQANKTPLIYMGFAKVGTTFLEQAAYHLEEFPTQSLSAISLHLFQIKNEAQPAIHKLTALPFKRVLLDEKPVAPEPDRAQLQGLSNGLGNGASHFRPPRRDVPPLDLGKCSPVGEESQSPKL